MQQHEAAGRATEVVDPRDRLLTAVTPLCQVHAGTNPSHFVRQCLVVRLESQPWNARGDPQRLIRPRTREAARGAKVKGEFLARHEDLSTDECRWARGDVAICTTPAVSAGRSHSDTCELGWWHPRDVGRVMFANRTPDHGKQLGDVPDLNAAHEPHRIEVLRQSRGSARFNRDPCGRAVINEVEFVFDVALGVKDQRQCAAAGGQPVNLVRHQVIEPTQTIRADNLHDASVRQINHGLASDQCSLLGMRVAVVPGNSGVDRALWSGNGLARGFSHEFITPVQHVRRRLPSHVAARLTLVASSSHSSRA